MTIGSLPLLVVFVLLVFVFPFWIWKSVHDFVFPIAIETIPLYREIRLFYIWFLASFLIPLIFFSWLGFTYNLKFYALVLFPMQSHSNDFEKLLEEVILTRPNLGFLVFIYVQSALLGWTHGARNLNKLKKHLLSKVLFESPVAELVGIWGALLTTKSTAKHQIVVLNIFTKSGHLYEGTLFDYSVKNYCVANVALRNVERFLINDIGDVMGERNEARYKIPGDLVYFEGSDISNINVKSITAIDVEHKSALLNENILGDESVFFSELTKELDKALESKKGVPTTVEKSLEPKD